MFLENGYYILLSYLQSVGVAGLGLRLGLDLGHQIIVVRSPVSRLKKKLYLVTSANFTSGESNVTYCSEAAVS
jgi:hypothetical protein